MGMSRKTLCQSSSVFAFSNGEKAYCKFVVLLSHSCDHGTRKYFRWRLEPKAKKSGHNHYKPVVLNKRKKQQSWTCRHILGNAFFLCCSPAPISFYVNYTFPRLPESWYKGKLVTVNYAKVCSPFLMYDAPPALFEFKIQDVFQSYVMLNQLFFSRLEVLRESNSHSKLVCICPFNIPCSYLKRQNSKWPPYLRKDHYNAIRTR